MTDGTKEPPIKVLSVSLPDPATSSGAFPDPAFIETDVEMAIAGRLKEAVRAAGGNSAVASRAGVGTMTLSRYLAGDSMKVSILNDLARGCAVTLDWLLTGKDESTEVAVRSNAPAEPPEDVNIHHSGSPGSIFDHVDLGRLAIAMAEAHEVYFRAGKQPDWRGLTRAMMFFYDRRDIDPAKLADLASSIDR